MCGNKEGSCACGCDDNAMDELFSYKPNTTESAMKRIDELEKELEKEEIVEINGVQYVRKNPKTLLEEPVLVEEDEKKILLNE